MAPTAMSEGYILQGESANLSSCRVPNRLLQQSALDQLLNDDERETMVLGPLAVHAQFDHDSDAVPETIPGMVVITSEQILFWQDAMEEPLWDLRVAGVCIDLHALTNGSSAVDGGGDERIPSAVYIQMSSGEASDDICGNTELFELTLRPVVSEESDVGSSTQALCTAITKLVSLHPIDPNDCNEHDSSPDADFSWMFDGLVMTADGDGWDSEDDDDEERNAMLERLDSLLIVPDELDHGHYTSATDGQFDDAEDDTELV